MFTQGVKNKFGLKEGEGGTPGRSWKSRHKSNKLEPFFGGKVKLKSLMDDYRRVSNRDFGRYFSSTGWV